MRYHFSFKDLPQAKRSMISIVALVAGMLVGVVVIFEKPIIKAATEFFSSC